MSEFHFIGIGGVGMSALARLLLAQNKKVSGSDLVWNQLTETLVQEGAHVFRGHAHHQIPKEATVIYSTDITEEHPERKEAALLGCPLWHRSELLAHLMHPFRSFAVAGTHGKTTTSALMAYLFSTAGLDPTFAVGGVVPQLRGNAQFGAGEFFLFEADESDGSFLRYHPEGAILTNVDRDHLPHYGNDFDRVKTAFSQFARQVKNPELLVWCGEDPVLREMRLGGISYGFQAGMDWQIVEYTPKGFGCSLDLIGSGRKISGLELLLTGRHNALNATAVFALGWALGLSEETLRNGLASFQGVLRRCERKGEWKGALFLDDYAHHPQEIAATLSGIRQAIGNRRCIVCFQPHRYTRTRDCWNDFGKAFDSADLVILTDIYAAGEFPLEGVSAEALVKEVKSQAGVLWEYWPRSALSRALSEIVQPGDVVVTMGAGDVTSVAKETLHLLYG